MIRQSGEAVDQAAVDILPDADESAASFPKGATACHRIADALEVERFCNQLGLNLVSSGFPQQFLQSLLGSEELPAQFEQLAVRRMIQGFDTADTGRQKRVGLLDPGCEFMARIGRSADEHRLCVRDRLRDVLEKRGIHFDVSAVARVGLVVQVLVRMGTAHHDVFVLGCRKVEYFGLLMIDPDQCVMGGVRAVVLLLRVNDHANQMGQGSGLHFFHDMGAVNFHRSLTEPHVVRHDLVGLPRDHQIEYLTLAGRE